MNKKKIVRQLSCCLSRKINCFNIINVKYSKK